MVIELKKSVQLAKAKDKKYQATSFWQTAIEPTLLDCKNLGINNFRNWPSALNYFVPTHGNRALAEVPTSLLDECLPNDKKSKQEYLNFTSGLNQATADYRVIKAILSDNCPELLNSFSESLIGNPTQVFDFEKRRYSRSSLNYLLGLAALSKHTNLKKLTNILEIGGGFGTLGEIVASFLGPKVKYCNLDIAPIYEISKYYLENALEDKQLILNNQLSEPISYNGGWNISVQPNWRIEEITGRVDLFVNFISFQEMEPNVVKNYLDYVNSLQPNWILLRQIREGKQLKTSANTMGVEVPITIDFYANYLVDYSLVLQDCLTFGVKTADNFHSDVLIFKRKLP